MSKPELEIAVLKTQMSEVQKQLGEIKSQVSTGFNELKKAVEKVHEDGDSRFVIKTEYDREIVEVKKLASTRLIQSNVLTMIVSIIITFLLTYFLTHQ